MDYYFPFFLEASSQFGYSDLQRIDFSGIQYFTGDVSGMPFSIFSFRYGNLQFFFWADGWKFTQVQANNFAGADPSGLDSEPSTDCWGVYLVLHDNYFAIGHSLFVGRNFSAVFQPGRGLHVSTSGFAGVSRIPAFE